MWVWCFVRGNYCTRLTGSEPHSAIVNVIATLDLSGSCVGVTIVLGSIISVVTA